MTTTEQKGKYQPWSHEEFMSDRRVRRMSPIAAKTYMMLLHEAFVCSTRPYLPCDEEELELMAYCTDHEEWLSVRATVLGMFEKITVGGVEVISNKRLVQDWAKLQEIRGARSRAGKKGGQAKPSNCLAKPNTCLTGLDLCLAKPSMEVKVSKVSKVKEVREENPETAEDSLSFSEQNDGQGDEVKIKKELEKICAAHGVRAGGYSDTWEEIHALGVAHSVGAVVRDFEEWLSELQGDDFPKGAVAKYRFSAPARLGGSSVSNQAIVKSPEIANLARELTHLSDGVIMFDDKQRVRLAEVLKEFTVEEVTAAFKAWMDEQDLNDLKNVQYLPGKFVQIVDSKAYSLRKRRAEKIAEQTARDAAVKRMQAEAEADRKKRAEERRKEEELFDPFAL